MKNEFIIIQESEIHNKGVFAAKDIKAGTKIIEYIGDKISKEESDRRADEQLERAKNNPEEEGHVYIFELDEEYDIDGNVPYNDAKWINHSCDPNCEVDIADGHIWIIAKKDIKKGEELSYNYCYDPDDFEDSPCRCGSKNCIGYIVAEEHWPEVRKKLEEKKPN
ncbi:MAG: SET domain-containing protein [Candidatus Nanoarchaeia archaeon]